MSRDEGAEFVEAAFADAADEEEVFGAAEGAVALAVFDDARGERGADAGQPLKLFARGAVDREGRVCLLGRRLGLRVAC